MASNTNAGHDGDDEEAARPEHLADVADGCGCAEVWEHLSEHRDEE